MVRGGALVAAASLAALVSALWGAWIGVSELDDWRREYGTLPPSLRDDPVALFLGYDDGVWETLRRSVDKGDRYAIVAVGEGRFEVRNYAAYTLLPAIQVSSPALADVVVYYGVEPPAGCVVLGRDVCVERGAP